MTAFTDVFARKEMKYRLSTQQYEKLLAVVQAHMQPAAYAKGRVNSLYYDTPHFELIERSLEKPLYKEKLRLRVYGGLLDETTPTFIEIKKKFKGIVYKRRIEVSLAAAEAFLSGVSYEQACLTYPLANAAAQEQSLDVRSKQIAHEIEYFLESHDTLLPAMLISCDRLSFELPDEALVTCIGGAQEEQDSLSSRLEHCISCTEDLRITFDTNLLAVPYPSTMKNAISIPDAERVQVIPPDGAIMEIKCMGALPRWLVDALDEVGAYKQSFSKYGTAYTRMLRKGA